MLASMGLFAFGLSAQEHLKSLDKNGLDNTISPRQDFYNHVNKKWMESHPLSPEYSRYGSFNILSDSSEHRVRRIVTGLAATNPAKGTDAYKIANSAWTPSAATAREQHPSGRNSQKSKTPVPKR